MSQIFDIIRIPFAFVIKWIYSWSHSYFVAIILFAILIKIVLFPFSIKQQKNSQKQAALRPKENIIRKKYAGRKDRPTQMKMNQEIQELYQKEHFSPLGGCLPMLLTMLVLLAVYAIVRSPLTYMANLPEVEKEGVENRASTVYVFKANAAYMVEGEEISGFKLTDFVTVSGEGTVSEALASGKFGINAETKVCTIVHGYREEFANYLVDHNSDRIIGETREAKLETIYNAIDAVPNLSLFSGFDLGETPNIGSLGSSEATLGQKLLLIIPVITLVTSYLGQALTRKFTYTPDVPEQKNQMRMMNIFMPLFSVFISFMVPAALAVYWIIQNITSPVQQFILAKMFPIKEITPEEMKEAERLYGGKAEKKSTPATSSGKKRKSLVYDDDDDEEPAEPKKGIREKENSEGSIVDQAPLKDEEKE